MNDIFRGLFDTETATVISVEHFLFCLGAALFLGMILAFTFMYKSRYTKSFVMTLALLPAVVCVVIMMVNGNVGAGVAVAGAFSLVRFRSVPGTAKEIVMLFLAMAAGLICGMGYLSFGVLFTFLMCLMVFFYSRLDLGEKKQASLYKTLHITIPEDLNYVGVFDEIFKEYTVSYDLVRVKTTNLGSMFRLTYDLVMKSGTDEKELIDKIRCRNGNLEIILSRQEHVITEL